VIEAAKDARKGVTASVIVQQGTLSVRQEIYTDEATGRVKLLTNDLGQALQSVPPGTPVELTGFREMPVVGSTVRDMAASYEQADDEDGKDDLTTFADDDFDFLKMLEDKPKLPLIVKADVEGTLEAIVNTLDEESVQLLKAEVGEVTEADLELATASKAAIIAFRTKVSKQILLFAKQQGIKIRSYDVIYQLIDDLQKQMLKLLEPTIDEIITGEAEIMQIFEMKGERIAGMRVKTGELKKHDRFHLQRDGVTIANPVIKTMMHGKQETDKVTAKSECGMTFKNKKLDFQVGDILIAYKLDESLA
jgi:translation initiation factor IF-2